MTDPLSLEERVARLETLVLASLCSCQYGNDRSKGQFTPHWYVSVRTCPIHGDLYARQQAPQWALDEGIA